MPSYFVSFFCNPLGEELHVIFHLWSHHAFELLSPWIHGRYKHIEDQQLLLLQTDQACKIIFDLQ